jgi:hypothetical protein
MASHLGHITVRTRTDWEAARSQVLDLGLEGLQKLTSKEKWEKSGGTQRHTEGHRGTQRDRTAGGGGTSGGAQVGQEAPQRNNEAWLCLWALGALPLPQP